MSCYQIASFRPQANLKAKYHGGRGLPPPMAQIPAVRFTTIPRTYPKLSAQSLKCRWGSPTCLFGGKDKSQGNNQDPPWKDLQNIFGDIGGKPSDEERLRKRIERQEYYGEEAGGDGDGGGGGGRSSRRGGGGGSGDDDSEDSKGGKEETFEEMMDELLQMILAILGVVFVYLYILYPDDVRLHMKDVYRFFLTRKLSPRLKEITDVFEEYWDRLIYSLTYTKEPQNEGGVSMEELLLNTTTWFDSPKKHRRLNKRYMRQEKIDFESFDFPTPSSGNVADAQIDSDDTANAQIDSDDTANAKSGDTANAKSGDTADDKKYDIESEFARLYPSLIYFGNTTSHRLPGDKDDNDIKSGDTGTADIDEDDINSGDTDSADDDDDDNINSGDIDSDDDDDDNLDDGYDSGADDTDSE